MLSIVQLIISKLRKCVFKFATPYIMNVYNDINGHILYIIENFSNMRNI